MVSAKEVLELYLHVDSQVKALLKIEQTWRKCHPCKNGGNCCIDSESFALPSEWAIIQNMLAKLHSEELHLLQARTRQKDNCVFRADDRCIIHDVRPLVCRVTPYFVFEQNGKLCFQYPNGSCRRQEGYVAYLPTHNTDLRKRFFSVGLINLKNKIYYLNGLKLHDHPVFALLQQEPLRSLLEWSTEYFDGVNPL